MRYRRALLLADLGQDAGTAFAALRALAPSLEQVVVVARMAAPAWFSASRADPRGAEALRHAADASGLPARVQIVPDLAAEAIAEICRSEAIDLVVAATRPRPAASALYEVRRSRRLPVLFAQGAGRPGPVRRVGCVVLGRRAALPIAAFLRDHADRAVHATLLGPGTPAPDEIGRVLDVAGIEAVVEDANARETADVRRWLARGDADLLAFAEVRAAVLFGMRASVPFLLLPPPAEPAAQRALEASDAAATGGPLRLRVELAAAVGDPRPLPDQPLAIVARGRVVATLAPRGGELELPADVAGSVSALGIGRTTDGEDPQRLLAGEQWVSVLRPGQRPLRIFDAEIPDEALRELAVRADADALAVRLRPTRGFGAIRRRLRAAGLPGQVLDARAVLDEGEALDVSEPLDALRLARVAAVLRRAGFPVHSIVHGSEVDPAAHGFAVVRAAELTSPAPAVTPPKRAPDEAPIAGNRVEFELDNALARRFLLGAIASARRTLHLQVYMAQDDAVGAEVEQALAEAAGRGVAVRVLVDSLHGLHGSLGLTNPLLARLERRPGIDLRVSRPITELPSLVNLKQRDHRKLVVADGRVALVGGRNLGAEYYRAFAEVPVSPATHWREVPWLDAGVRLEGPAVAAVEEAFREAWTDAGGAGFPIEAPPAAGPSPVRVIGHRGLRDARTLETYRALVEGARSHVYVVNGFPLVLELQHALVRAVKRGVRVRVLAGHVAPTWNGRPFEGPWSTPRTAATELVHSRLDPIVAAGGEAFLLAVRDVPGWSPGLGVVQPHVHAKAIGVDGERCAIGSANLDVTSAYWESELMLVLEDPRIARDFEARVDALLEGSTRLRADDPAWREAAERRGWMRHWPGVLSV